MDTQQNHGFIESEIVPNEHYYLGDGCLPADVLMPNGHGWGDYLPSDEVQQKNGLETMNCTNYGTLHALATLGKKKFGAKFQTNLSERYTGVCTGTTKNGNDPHAVIEKIRTLYGVIPEVFLSFDDTIDTWDEYYSPRPMFPNLLAIGVSWLKKYSVGHEWVFLPTDPLTVKQGKIKEALKYSPCGVSVYAWAQHADGLYYKDSTYDNHWVELYDYVEGKYWMIFDSYDNTRKLLDWNFNFAQGKRYSLDLNVSGETDTPAPRQNWVAGLAQSLISFVKDIFKLS